MWKNFIENVIWSITAKKTETSFWLTLGRNNSVSDRRYDRHLLWFTEWFTVIYCYLQNLQRVSMVMTKCQEVFEASSPIPLATPLQLQNRYWICVDMQPSVSREGFKYDLWDLGPGTLEANPCVEYLSSLSSSETVIIRWGIILSSMKRMSKSLLYAMLFCARWYLTIFPLFVIYILQSLKSISKCRAAKFISMPYGSYFWRLYQGSHLS